MGELLGVGEKHTRARISVRTGPLHSPLSSLAAPFSIAAIHPAQSLNLQGKNLEEVDSKLNLILIHLNLNSCMWPVARGLVRVALV